MSPSVSSLNVRKYLRNPNKNHNCSICHQRPNLLQNEDKWFCSCVYLNLLKSGYVGYISSAALSARNYHSLNWKYNESVALHSSIYFITQGQMNEQRSVHTYIHGNIFQMLCCLRTESHHHDTLFPFHSSIT